MEGRAGPRGFDVISGSVIFVEGTNKEILRARELNRSLLVEVK
jgi:hypothetical protein